MKTPYLILFLVILASCDKTSGNKVPSLSSKEEVIEDLLRYDLIVEDSIILEPQNKRVFAYKANRTDEGLLFHYHNGSNSVDVFNAKGEHLNGIYTPSIAEPKGLNRISDYYYKNRDSIFVYDSEYNRIVLVNEDSEIKGFWELLKNFNEIGRSGAGKIIDVYNKGGNLFIDLNSILSQSQHSSKLFYETTKMVFKINLTTMEIVSGVKYPEDSPYMDYLFWSGTEPSVQKYKSDYLVTFPFDPRLFVYDSTLRLRNSVESYAKDFPKAIGNEFESQQENDFVRINRKLNGFNLRTKGIFDFEGKKVLGKVYRSPLGDKNDIPEDISEFMKGNYVSDFYLQLFHHDNDQWQKMAQDILLPKSKMGNLVHVDENGKFYFVGIDVSREREILYVCSLR